MKLRLERIGPFKEREFRLKRMSVICGPSGSGKSTLGSVLELLFTGHTSLARPWELCPEGFGAIELEENGFYMRAEIKRASPTAFTAEERGMRLEGYQALKAVQTRLGFPHPKAARFLLAMRHKTAGELIKALGSLCTAVLIVPEVLKAVSGTGLEELSEVKKVLEGRISPTAAAEMLKQKAEKYRKEAERIQKTLLPPELEIGGRTIRLDQLDIESAEKALEKLKETLKKAEEAERVREIRKELEKRKQYLEKAAARNEEASKYRTLLETRQNLRERLRYLHVKIKALDQIKTEKTCPILGGNCPAASCLEEDELEQFVFETLGEFEGVKKELLTLEEELKTIDSTLKALGSPKEVEAELKRIKEEVQKLPEPEKGLPSSDSIRERIERGETVLQYLRLYKEQEKTRQELERLQQAAQNAEEAATLLERFIGMPWISPKLLEITAQTQKILGTACINIRDNRLELPLWPSRSETVFIESVLKASSLEFCGGGMMMVDDLDWTAPEQRRNLLRYIYEKGLRSVLIMRTEQPPTGAKEDVEIIYLEGGKKWSRQK